MNYRNKTLFDLQHGRCAIHVCPMTDYGEALEKVNRVLRFFAASEVREGNRIARYVSLYRKNLGGIGWKMDDNLPSNCQYITLDEAISLISDTPEVGYGPTVANLRAGRCAVRWSGLANINLVALLATAFPEDCINGIGYRPYSITNDPEHDGEWDHVENFEGPVYNVSDFKGDLIHEIEDLTDAPEVFVSRHERNKQLPMNQVVAQHIEVERDNYLLARENHTGTQPAASISDFDEEVKRVIRQMSEK